MTSKPKEAAAQVAAGRALFFGKARCSNCHVGDTFTDHGFHNIGVRVSATPRRAPVATPWRPSNRRRPSVV